MPQAELAAGTRTGVSSIAGVGTFAESYLAIGDPVARFPAAPGSPADLPVLNHSCDPNLGWAGETELVTIRTVAAGEELTCDYATFLTDPAFVLYCHCGTYRCRQVIEGDDWRIPQLQARYERLWHPAVRRRIEAASR